MSNRLKLSTAYCQGSALNLSHRILAVIFLAAGLMASEVSFAGKPIKVGDTAPDWILSNSQNESTSFYRDTPNSKSVILFWATWCPYCKALMPELERLRTEINDPTLKFYALNIWEDGDPVGFLKENQYNFALMLNADKVAKRYKVNGTPGLFVIDENKKIIYKRNKGEKPSDVYAAIHKLLSTTP
ncbi:MAG: TlpA family protein disulfide reductase [Cellvibrionaceae bacterium]